MPAPNRVLLQTAFSNFTPHTAATVNFRNDTRAPLLLVAGGQDRLVSSSLVKANFELLGKQAAGAGGEIQLTDAMLALARTQPFYGLKFEGRTYDCGSKIGFLTANVAYALDRPDLAPEFRAELKQMLAEK